MVKLNRIYTKTGDQGTTGLCGTSRVSKHDARICAIGDVDEANALCAQSHLFAKQEENAEIEDLLERIQHDLFDLGADLAQPLENDENEGEKLRIQPSQVEALEHEIDRFNEHLQPLRSFVLPGGSALATSLHIARTVVRRGERSVSFCAQSESLNPEVLRYLNRLSDLFFVLARVANNNGKEDTLWKPGKNR
ncbi:MAG: cob(I)yrinic acid a,c-diamide adenosyltransferase [bacterium]|nr:cob(I)yrinic acid a,c-diamide adenosyltransferase [bacterium]